MTNETNAAAIFVDLKALIADGAKATKAGAKAKSVAPWITDALAKIAKGEQVAIAPAIWEKGMNRVRKAFKDEDANNGYKLRAAAYKNHGAVVAYVLTRELDV